ncbi:DNA-binding protein D-ETS-4 [Planococcus citri]|uniref:DNA-binding protein D-ETS-4 n=1 Tax=Planococcus citri TaxID=170843 RepID=UPI0031FA2167
MVFNNKTSLDYDAMLQIVPSAGFSPPASSEYSADYSVDSFDLSLLPGSVENDSAFSSSCNGNSNVQQFFSLYYDVNSPPAGLFGSYDNTVSTTKDNSYLGSSKDLLGSGKQQPRYDDVMSMFKKTEPSIDKCSSWRDDFSTLKDTVSIKSPSDEHVLSKNTFLDMEIVDWESKNEWDTIRVQSSIPSVTSSSNCSSPDFQLCPSTPPDFDSILPLEDIKQEITLNLQNLLTSEEKPITIDDKYKEKKPELLRSILEKSSQNDLVSKKHQINKCSSMKDDNHKLLREVLKDTSFQKKYNLKPFDIEGLGTCYQTEIKTEDGKILNKEDVCDVNLAEGIIAPMLSKAIEQLMQDVDNTCIMLGIPRDPKKWSIEDVRGWLLWNSRQYNLPIPMDLFNVTGATLTSMTEQDFQQRAPQCGSILFAQLEIWKVNSMEDTHLDVNTLLCDTNAQSSSPSVDISDEDDEEDEEMTDATQSFNQTIQPGMKVSRGSGSHIHLWQFLKELLSSPQTHGSCIRWLDRNKGVFKIEDSVRVARLWGKRKNRPAMNYDKLSRSIRQYYKKGIMKKTERSQRLVYQFCTPYNL